MLISAFSAIGGAKLKSKKTAITIILLLSSAMAGCAATGTGGDFGAGRAALSGPLKPGQKARTAKTRQTSAQTAALGRRYSATGRASWYGSAFQGKRTANGEIFNMYKLTAAHRGLPLPSYARVTNLQNGSSLIVRINDRGPYAGNRIIDLSRQAAQLLDYHHGGLADVKVDYVGPAPAEGHDEAFLRASYRPPAGTALARGEAEADDKSADIAGEPAAPQETALLSYKANAADGEPQAPAEAAIAAAADKADGAENMNIAAAPIPAAKPAAAAEAAPQAGYDQARQLGLALTAIKAGKAQLLTKDSFKPSADQQAVK